MEQTNEQLKDQLKKQEKLASLGLLVAGIAHEVQNPLNFVINFSKMSDKLLADLSEILEDNADKLSDDDREEVEDIITDLQENLKKITEHGERAVNIVRDILLVSRGKENEFIPTDICRIVKEYVWLSYHAMRANYKNFNITIHENYQEDIPQVMIIPQEVKVSITSSNQQIIITIADNGEGMSDEAKAKLYENFFTTKPAGQGTGLGMGIIRDIIENKHGGSISFDSQAGEGTQFTLIIPIRK